MTGTYVESGGHARAENADAAQRVRSVLLWEADPWAANLTLLSDASDELLGVSREEVERQPRFLESHVPPADWPRVLAALYRAATQPGVQTCQHRMVRADGATLWAQTSVHKSDRSNGSVYLTGATVDVTALLEHERQELGADSHSRLLIQNLREYGVFMVTLEGNVASWNPGARQLKGYSAEEAIGRPLSRFFPEDEILRGTPEQLLREAELQGQADYEGWLVRKDGSRFWASLTMSAVADESGKLRGYSNVSKDLTERRQTEQALRQSEEQFRLLVESVQDYGVFMLSPDGKVENWNRGAQRLKGYRAPEIIGAPFATFFPPEEVARGTPLRLLRDAEHQGTSSYEGWLVRKDGERFWAQATFSAVEDENGSLRGFSNVARDVTERKRAEDLLREGEEQHRLLLDSLQDYAVFMISPQGKVASWSPGAERVNGYKAKDIIGSPLERFFPPGEQASETPRRLLEVAREQGTAEYEGWVVRGNGSRLWASVQLTPVWGGDGLLRGFSIVARDYTVRMRAERALAFLADVGTVLGGSLDHRATGEAICRLATRGLARWCFVTVRDGDALEPLAVAHVEARWEDTLRGALQRRPHIPRIAHGVSSVIDSGQPELAPDVSTAPWLSEALGLEDAVLRELRPRSYICVPLTVRGNTMGAITLGAASDGRFTADDLRVAEELARRAALALDNARLLEQSQRAVRLREEVLAVVSHDLRSPLAAITLAATQLGKASDERTRTSGERIERSADRMNHLIEDLLDFSSIERGRLRLTLEACDAARLVEEAREALQPQAEKAGMRLQTELSAAGVQVSCDRRRVLQAFTNLVVNALKFSGAGGAVTLACRAEANRVVFSVGDTGQGLSEEAAGRVFDRYWMGESSSGRGLGLGLAITKGIVESHGGRIWVESKPGEGATFFFALPRAG